MLICGIESCYNEAKYMWDSKGHENHVVCEQHKEYYIKEYKIKYECDKCRIESNKLFWGNYGRYCEKCFLNTHVKELSKPKKTDECCEMCEWIGKGKICYNCSEARLQTCD